MVNKAETPLKENYFKAIGQVTILEEKTNRQMLGIKRVIRCFFMIILSQRIANSTIMECQSSMV